MPLQYWKDAEAAFVAKAQDTGRAPRKRKKKLPKGATHEDQHEVSAPKTKKSKPVKPNSKSMTSKSSTASSQNKLSNSAAEVAPPNHVQNVDTARVPSDCEDNAIKAQLSHVDGENVIGLFDGPDVEFDPIPSSGPFDQEEDDDGGGKATPEPRPNTIAAPTRAVSRQHNYATGAVSAEGYVSTTAPNLNKNAAAAIVKKNSPKPKKCAATDWSIEIKSHEDSGINSASQLDRIKDFIDVTLNKADGLDADSEVDNDIQEQNDCTTIAAVQEDVSGEYTTSDSGIADAWESIVQSDVDDLAIHCRDGLCCLHATNKARGSINSDRKKKSLLGRWLTHKQKPPEDDDANSNDKTIERNMHVKVEMKEKRDNQELLSDLVDYRVLAINNKTYNKWYLCEKGRQAWSKNTGHKKNRVLLQMITYDHFKQKWQVCDPSDGTKWTKTESYYVLVDAGDIHDVVGKLSED